MTPAFIQPSERDRSEIENAIEILQNSTALPAANAIEVIYRHTLYGGEVFAETPFAVDRLLTSLSQPSFSNTAMALRYVCDLLAACNANRNDPNRDEYTTSIRQRIDDDLSLLEGFIAHPDPIAKTCTTFIVADRERNRDVVLETARSTLRDEPIVQASSILMLGSAFPSTDLFDLLPKEVIPASAPAVDGAIAKTIVSLESELFQRAVAAAVEMLKAGERYYALHFLFEARREFDFQGQFPWFRPYYREWLYECVCREQYHTVEPIAAEVRGIIAETDYDDEPFDVFPIVSRLFPEGRKLRPFAQQPVLHRFVLESLAGNEDFWNPARTMTDSLDWLSIDGETLDREALLT